MAPSNERTEDLLAELIQRGQATGELRRASTPEGLARFMAVTLNGISIAARTGMARSEPEAVVDEALSAVGVPRGA